MRFTRGAARAAGRHPLDYLARVGECVEGWQGVIFTQQEVLAAPSYFLNRSE